MPGPSVHVPVILCAAGFGYLLCWPHPLLRPLLLIWLVAGVYLGRDFAVLCHYAIPLALLPWIALFVLSAKAHALAQFGVSHRFIAALISTAMGILVMSFAYLFTRNLHR